MAYEGNYPGTQEEAILHWISDCIGQDVTDGEFGDVLHNGVLLCQLANKIHPGCCKKVYTGRMPFPQRENVTSFLQACRDIGVAEYNLFTTQQLFEGKNLKQVANCLSAVGRQVYSVPGYEGPALGSAPAEHRGRHHTATHLNALWVRPNGGRNII